MPEVIWLSPESGAEFLLNPLGGDAIETLVSLTEHQDNGGVLAVLKQAVLHAPDNPASYLERLSTDQSLPESLGS